VPEFYACEWQRATATTLVGVDAAVAADGRGLQIVGVSQDTAVQALGGDSVPILYLPSASSSLLVVRVAGSAAGTVRTLERGVINLVPGAAVTVVPMTARLSGLLLPIRVATSVLTALGAVGLVLAMIGLYGVVTYAANRRRFEIGLRIALGASRSAIVRLMMRDTIMMVGVGSIIGSVISSALIRAIWPLLAGWQRSVIPVALVAVFILMLTVGIVAALRPTLRASALDPMGALRQD
jgi:ABC-type antimicrobial peptide transport system permease subunit